MKEPLGSKFWAGVRVAVPISVFLWVMIYLIIKYDWIRYVYWTFLVLLIVYVGHYIAKGIIIYRRNKR